MSFQSYHEIESWREARCLTRNVYEITSKGRLQKDFGLRDQMQRSSVSVMSNIAEGFGRGSNRDFIRFLKYARGSLLELQSQLYVAVDVGYIHDDRFQRLLERCRTIARLINGLIRYLEESDR